MAVKITNNTIIIGLVVQPSDFTGLVKHHPVKLSEIRELEHKASDLRAAGFPEEQLASFIERVCRFGNFPGIAGRVLKRNDLSVIRSQFVSAANALNSDVPDVQGALREINKIRGLGKPSFASKHLRFLRPEVCPVLDRTISKHLQYPLDEYGYKQFSDDCLRIAETLQQHGVSNPMGRESGKWFAADVEMALFQYLREPSSSIALLTRNFVYGEWRNGDTLLPRLYSEHQGQRLRLFGASFGQRTGPGIG